MKLFRLLRRPAPPPPSAVPISEKEAHIDQILTQKRISPLALYDPAMALSSASGSGMSTIAEHRIRAAIRSGEFDNLAGKGKPLKPGFDSPFVEPAEVVLNRIMIKQGVAPDWVEAGNEVERDILAQRKCMKKEWEARKRYLDTMDPGTEWRVELERRAEALNQRIRHYNLIVPAPFLEKAPVILENEIASMLHEMPPRDRPKPRVIECW